MGNQKQKWTSEEEDALLAGVKKHGPGKWKNILKDPEFAPFLTHRSNIDLKDKWRNLSVSTATQGTKEKSRAAPKAKAIVAVTLSNSNNQSPASTKLNATADTAGDEPQSQSQPQPQPQPQPQLQPQNNTTQEGKNVPRYYTMIFEALSSIKDSNGCDIGKIVSFIEQRHEVPPNFRRQLSSKLRRLVSQGKLEKVENCYKVKKDNNNPLAVKTPPPKPKDVRQRISQYTTGALMPTGETVEDAARAAAYKVADAENKSFLAAEAVKEAERIAKMAEDTDSMLHIIKEMYEKCSRGEIVLLA